ncbi:MAG: hypothetical protein CMC15_11865 [Flavobacteriaceae bacterium]|nr:hypothetical protein [Flavobacteriaceae bacterium]|tara:strand:+ start:154104 stop:154517 length:414 start_codon:yes stop_codon:yes gene_type:complete
MTKPPISFWIFAILGLLWNIFAIYFVAYELDNLDSGITEKELAIINGLPTWYVVLFVIALISEVFGCFLLIIRKKLATTLFAVSLITGLFIECYWLFATNIVTVSWVLAYGLPVLAIVVAVVLYVFSKWAARKKWIL